MPPPAMGIMYFSLPSPPPPLLLLCPSSAPARAAPPPPTPPRRGRGSGGRAMETLMVDRVHSSLRLFMNHEAVFLCERLCPPRNTPSRPPCPLPLTPPFSMRSEPTPLRRRN
ncbi:hypothetical protein ZWY2020_001304 [Hordeum vulgare]|nr:hypothetical protein ZWY2020_001304 [Hordeum vulgare]